MRNKQAKKLRKAANAIAQLTGENAYKQYKILKSIHKSLPHNEKQNNSR